jgi:hypothetical protein
MNHSHGYEFPIVFQVQLQDDDKTKVEASESSNSS